MEVINHKCVLSITFNEQARRSKKEKRLLMAATRQMDEDDDPDAKSAVNEECLNDAGFDDIASRGRLYSTQSKRAAWNCRWKKRPLMVVTSFLNISMKAL